MLEKQKEYCKKRGLPLLAFEVCPICKNVTIDTDKEHITGCSNCNRTWCE